MKLLSRKYIYRVCANLLVLFTGLILSACSGGGASVNGTGQDADPIVVDFAIAYIKRPLPVEVDDNGSSTPVIENLREPIAFNPGAAIYVRDRATTTASDVNITDQAFEEGALYDVKDLEVSFDGLKLIFAMRAPEIEDADEDMQPKWNIWEYNHETKILRPIITSLITAEEGDDVAPHYLPNGKIVFSSTRQRLAKAVLLDEGKPQFNALEEDRNVEALSLHVMNDDGSEIKQITFNQSHDTDPSVLVNGKVVFSRWDNYSRNTINLYQVNPDGTGLEILYGMHSHQTGSEGNDIDFISPRETQDGRLLVHLKSATSFRLGGELAYINWQEFIDINQTVNAGASDTVGQISATPLQVRTDDLPSSGGRYSSMYPLFDTTNRMLVSWSPCRLDSVDAQNNPIIIACTEESLAVSGVQEAQPRYGVWIFNPTDNTQLPIVLGQEGIVYHEVVALSPRTLPAILPNVADTPDGEFLDEKFSELRDENVGVVHIKSVYDFDGVDVSPLGISAMSDPLQSAAADRTARFLRIVKAVSLPDEDLVDLNGTAFGRSQAQLMKDILGYAAVEPDGSAKFKVPADVAFFIDIVDVNGRRVGERHQNWMSVKAGEVKECNGCHTRNSELPHGRVDAQAASINNGALTGGIPFPNTNPALIAEQNETMAEVYSRVNGFQDLSVNIQFVDNWTDPALRTIDTPFEYNYSTLLTPSPTSLACLNNWTGRCRITINYPQIIQPIWDLDRSVFDTVGNLIQDNTCVTCHSRQDALGQLQVPLAQLELVGTTSTDQPDHLTSYRELFFNDNALELLNGALLDQLIVVVDANGNIVYEVDEDGNLILDANGDPIPVLTTVNVASSLNTNSAVTSQRFFQKFAAGGSHQGWLSAAELKLISEWVDIGGQYFNNPFVVPQ